MQIPEWLWHEGRLLGIDWAGWKLVGWLGNLVFFSRFFVQWYATERRRQVVVPVSFWWLSLAGSGLLLAYAIRQQDAVFICAYVFTWIPYIRNLIIHRRHLKSHQLCPACGQLCVPLGKFCSDCGTALPKT